MHLHAAELQALVGQVGLALGHGGLLALHVGFQVGQSGGGLSRQCQYQDGQHDAQLAVAAPPAGRCLVIH